MIDCAPMRVFEASRFATLAATLTALSAPLSAKADDATKPVDPTPAESKPAPAPAEPPPATGGASPWVESPGRRHEGAERGEHPREHEHIYDRGLVRVTYSDGNFYFRAPHDELVIWPQARMQVDGYAFAGPGVSQYQRTDAAAPYQGLATNLAFKRFTLEMSGTLGKHIFFNFGGNFGPTSTDASENPQYKAGPYQAYVGWEPFIESLRFMVGQFPTPFTMENIANTRYTSFMEFSQTVRSVAAPYNMDLGAMALGSVGRHHLLDWQVGVFGGDGANHASPDNRVDLMGRVIVRPFSGMKGPISKAHIGGSFRWGERGTGCGLPSGNPGNCVSYDAPAMVTPGGYQYWVPYYGKNESLTHIIPASTQLGAAFELYVPFERFDLRGELVYVHEGRRESTGGSYFKTDAFGSLKGLSYYAQVDVWPWGTPRIGGEPGVYARQRAPHHSESLADPAIQVALRWEQILLNYDSIDQSPAGTMRGTIDTVPGTGGAVNGTNIHVNALSAAVTFWATKVVRVTGQYTWFNFPGTGPASYTPTGASQNPSGPTPDGSQYNQAQAPGQRYGAYDGSAHDLHEFSVRFQVAF